ncbi:uncharacterized protein LOC116262241 isoform X3 [Nymphaea colorata]|uniref:uncharacterized protein LOC116262241 isoform X3 n=1 Tax=Nymphaea colorata TaxID=210225 RepID=UPI00129E6555|nr:uncharacterized protein LOC116262241 isoform X3 [Nymphaea colorata]
MHFQAVNDATELLLSRRSVLVMEPANQGDAPEDITPPDFSVRTLAQEYGGGAFFLHGEMIIFSNYKDQRLYKQIIGDDHPFPLTLDYGGPIMRYADGVVDSYFSRYITVREDHRKSSLNPTTTIVAIDLKSRKIEDPKILISGSDFYAFPRVDPTGRKVAWVEWNHPNMPWDRSELWVGYVSDDGDIYKRICVAGCDLHVMESPTEPLWSTEGELFFVTDRGNGYWNVHKWVESNNEVQAIYTLDAEFTSPLWLFGIKTFDFIRKGRGSSCLACTYRQKGRSYFGLLDVVNSSLTLVDIPFTDIRSIIARGRYVCMEGASPTVPLSIGKVILDENCTRAVDFSTVWSSFNSSLEYMSCISTPEMIEFPTEIPGQKAYAYFYPPCNNLYEADPEEKPPLLMKSHGGPTSEARGILDLSIQYWTSRGWAFADVNYGGSTGYGREYRERLLRSWGIVDVSDCCSCAEFLVDTGRVDSKRLCIFGRSAGGYTALACLAFKQIFKAGASLFGVADLTLLKDETHKFESHYIETLVGDDKSFIERSPINNVDKFSCPVILFQGLDDKVVPPSQARAIYKALKMRGLPVALVEYEDEQHGFRKAENIRFTLEQQMVFFARVLGNMQVVDEISPIHIDNFD